MVVLCVHGWCSVIPRALMGHDVSLQAAIAILTSHLSKVF